MRRTSGSNYMVYIPLVTLILLVGYGLINLSVSGTAMGFGIWTATRIEQIHHNNHECLPDRYAGNECKIGIERKADTDSEFCTVENRKKGYECDDACISGDGECDGEGTCVGDCLFNCAVPEDCPYLGDPAPGITNVTDCVLSGCTTFYFGPDPLGLCGSEKSFQTCEDVLPESEYKGCTTISQLCDSGLVLACVYTANCHHVEDFDPMIVRDVKSAKGASFLSSFNSERMKAVFDRKAQ